MNVASSTPHNQEAQRSLGAAYKSFLLSRDENLILKIAPLLLLFGSPEILISNLIPVVGEAVDIGSLGLALLVAYRTYSALQKYR